MIAESQLPVIIRDSLEKNDIKDLLGIPNVIGITTDFYVNKDIMKAKMALEARKYFC